MALSLESIHYAVGGQPYLTDINQTFDADAFNVLLGRTLAGKTSLLRLIAGLDRPQQGRIMLDGQDITDLSVQQRNVSMVYQQFINYPNLTVWDNIASPLLLQKVAKPEIKQRVEGIAELLQISAFLQQRPAQLSGGQQQRCAMARALVKDAQILLFDEPLVNLDYKLRESLRHELKQIIRQRNSIAIYATTEAHEALALGGNTVLLHQGKVLQSGDSLTQFYQPQNLPAANLYHEPPLNEFSAQFQQGQLVFAHQHYTLPERLKALPASHYRCAIRPDHLSLVSTGEQEMMLTAKVDVAEISASETFLHLSLAQAEPAHQNWVAHLTGVHPFNPDQTLTLYLPLSKLYVFDRAGSAIAWPPANLDRQVG